MRVIFKYGPLEVGEQSPLSLPRSARVVHFSGQAQSADPRQHPRSDLFLWAEVDPSRAAELAQRRFVVVPTGTPVEDGARYLLSCQTDGYFMWHLFEL